MDVKGSKRHAHPLVASPCQSSSRSDERASPGRSAEQLVVDEFARGSKPEPTLASHTMRSTSSTTMLRSTRCMSHHSRSARCFERFKASSFMSFTVFYLAGERCCRSSATERPVSYTATLPPGYPPGVTSHWGGNPLTPHLQSRNPE